MNYLFIKSKRLNKNLKIGITTVIFMIILFTIFIDNTTQINDDINIENNAKNIYKPKNPKLSYLWATLDLTNPSEVNNTGTSFTHYSEIHIKGRLYNRITGDNKSGNDIILVVDGIQNSSYTDITDGDGKFQINYTIDPSLNIFSIHIIEVFVTSNIPPEGEVEYRHHYIIEVNATSYFDIDNYNFNNPQLAGGYYDVPGFLRYDNNSGIQNEIINYYWFNKSFEKWPSDTFNTNPDGSFKYIPIPEDNASNILYLNLTYAENAPYINGSQKIIAVKLYRNITCVWNTVGSASQGDIITIGGQIFARNDSNLLINFTDVRLLFEGGASIGNTTTNANGNFAFNYQIPGGISGPNEIIIELWNFSNVYSNTTHFISIGSPPITPAGDIGDDDEETPPPFQNFFIIFIPIIIGVVVALGLFVVFFLKRQKEESLIVKLPLEDRIINFKILKDTGRLEEALSYLFQSIYMELINAKYGVVKKENETIRDFAIISVKELKLNPNSIYPFIQNIERIIYDRPFIIKEQDFYNSVELFSPIYFELTGFYFTLNF